MRPRVLSLVLIALVLLFSLWMVFTPRVDLPSPAGGRFQREGFKLGLDLKGGIDLVLEADLSQARPGLSRDEVMGAVEDILRLRVDRYGVAEPTIQRELGGNRVRVQLPGVKEAGKAAKEIGDVWQLNYRKLSPESLQGNTLVWKAGDQERRKPMEQMTRIEYLELTVEKKITWLPATGKIGEEELHLTGDYLKGKPQVGVEQLTAKPELHFEWDEPGTKLFEQITAELVGKPLGIFLDENLISAPIVQEVIHERVRITGLTLEEAQDLSRKLELGRLPVPLRVSQPRVVDASLGAESLARSIRAGVVGVVLLLLFLVAYYRFLGLVASLTLLSYGVFLLALFKLIPVTLTLSGIAGFVISLGMAVDANVLVFERIKEELRGGRTVGAAIEVGFRRAWSAVADSNITTLLVCVILFLWGRRFAASPTIMGFSLTLGIGILVSMFTAMVVSRHLLRLTTALGVRSPSWFAVALKEKHAGLS